MKKQWLIIIILLLSFSCYREGSYRDALAGAERVAETNTDSLGYYLNKIRFPQKLHGREKADYWRLNGLYKEKTNRTAANDSSILFSLQYYHDHGINEHLAETYLLAASHCSWKGDTAGNRCLLNDGLAFAVKNGDTSDVSVFYRIIGQEQMAEKQYGAAIESFRRAAVHSSDKAASEYLMGICFARNGQIDSSIYYFERAISEEELRGDSLTVGHYMRNYADMLYATGDYTGALRLMRRRLGYPEKRVNVYTTMSGLHLALHDYDSAQFYLDRAKEMFDKKLDTYSVYTAHNNIAALQAVIDHVEGRNISGAISGLYMDSVWWDNGKQVKLRQEETDAKERSELQNLMLENSRQQILLIFAAVLLLVVVSSGFVYIYIRRKKTELQEAEETREALRSLLADAVQSDNNYDRDDRFFKKIVMQQLGLIRLVATTPTEHNQELLKQMSRIANKDIPVDDLLVWNDLYGAIDSVYDNFHVKLSVTYGGVLNEMEIQLCCLLCAGFSTKEISVVTQQGIRTVYQRKSTIRHKLGMVKKDDILAFLQDRFSDFGPI